MCNFDAIEMSHEHEMSKFARNDNRTDLEKLLDMGKSYQQEVGWKPKKGAEKEEAGETEN